MKLWKTLTIAFAGVAALALALTANAANSVVGSNHDLNHVFGDGTVSNAEVCKPCHTPHQQPDKTVGTLWNHTLNAASNYTLYGTGSSYLTTIDETSRKCLGCHDGTIAIDNFGGHTGTSVGNMPAGFVIGVATGSAVNLQHDHPIDKKYTAAATDGSWTSTRMNDPTKFTSSGYSTGTTTGGFTAVTYKALVSGVETAIPATGGLRFYTPSGTTDNYITCGTCHTPHDNTYGFLRITNYKSQLCLTCHVK